LYKLLPFKVANEYLTNELFSVVYAHHSVSVVMVIVYREVVCGANVNWHPPLKNTCISVQWTE